MSHLGSPLKLHAYWVGTGRYGPHGRYDIFRGCVLWIGHSALTSNYLLPEISLGEDLFENGCGGGNCARTESVVWISCWENVLQFVAPDFLSDIPKKRKADDGRDNAVGLC
ncbi:hypothetical protein J6590_082400 [Homalodisca vitripennis]|nr:hypothetical protein J6590_082400 [Homalodisca vitripennis]